MQEREQFRTKFTTGFKHLNYAPILFQFRFTLSFHLLVFACPANGFFSPVSYIEPYWLYLYTFTTACPTLIQERVRLGENVLM